MHPRHRLDLRAGDVARALVALVVAPPRREAEQGLLSVVGAEDDALATLSVRAGWDLLLTELAWAPGSEVLVSAITHPAMPALVRDAGLLPVPVEIDLDTLLPRTEVLAAALTPWTRAVLVAQLFGSRSDLSEVASFCHEHGLLLVEDAAQAWAGPETLRSAADVTLVSFGLLKTATAVGGALVRASDPALLARLRRRHATWPVQARSAYARRLLRALALLLLARPHAYGLLLDGCVRVGADPDALLDRLTRPSTTADRRVRRQQPSPALLSTMDHRLRPEDLSTARVRARAAVGEALRARLPAWLPQPGERARRTHWLFPVRATDPADLVARLRRAGVDASAGTSNLVALTDAGPAADLMEHVVYVPAYPELPADAREAVRRVLADAAGVGAAPAGGAAVPLASRP